MNIPFEPVIFGYEINIHLVLEYVAFFAGFRYYMYLRRNTKDLISTTNRLSIIIGAVFGAFLGSRVFGFLEQPQFISFTPDQIINLFTTKTIMGGLFGGLLGVELAKKLIGEKRSSGDLFTFPIILGIIIGRIGCFLSGVNDFTYGKETNSFLGMDLGDGIMRYPLALFEVLFLIILWYVLKYIHIKLKRIDGYLFKYFMISYFMFRFCIEFLKPNTFFILELSSIQYLCILCFVYYQRTIRRQIIYAYKTIHLL